MSTFLNVENIHVYYGAIHAIRGVSFHVNEGEVVTRRERCGQIDDPQNGIGTVAAEIRHHCL